MKLFKTLLFIAVGVLVITLLVTGCAPPNYTSVTHPDGTVEVVILDRVMYIANSNMSDDAKLEAIRQIVEREEDRGTNILEILEGTALSAVLLAVLR